MDLHSRIREKDTSYRDEMLSKIFGISYRDHVTNEEVGNRIRQAIGPYEDLSSHHCEETQTEMVWAQNKINRTFKDDPTGHCARREKERQTEEEMGRQRNGMDRIQVFERLKIEKNEEQWLPDHPWCPNGQLD